MAQFHYLASGVNNPSKRLQEMEAELGEAAQYNFSPYGGGMLAANFEGEMPSRPGFSPGWIETSPAVGYNDNDLD